MEVRHQRGLTLRHDHANIDDVEGILGIFLLDVVFGGREKSLSDGTAREIDVVFVQCLGENATGLRLVDLKGVRVCSFALRHAVE